MTWSNLPAGPLGASADRPGIDANLVWADASEWRDFLHPEEAAKEHIPVIAELRPGTAAEFTAGVVAAGGSVPAVYHGREITHCTAMLTPELCKQLLHAGGPVVRMDLQASLIPQRPRVLPAAPTGSAGKGQSEQAQGSLLLGVIDRGCPFAHQHLRSATGGTRILNLWLQDERLPGRTLKLGGTPAETGYGTVLPRGALDKLMLEHTSADGFVNEDACYAGAGMDELRQRFLHGAAVLDLFVGPRTLAARTSRDPNRPPTWATADDEAGQADIVFVQLPRDAVQDSTSAGLTRCVLDGLRYIVSCAGPATERIVVNISDGSSRGSHDGASIIETAMAAIVAEQAARKRRLTIVLPAGNSRDEERHAQIDGLKPGAWSEALTLRLPPACEAPSQVIVRIPEALRDAEIRLVPPGADRDAQAIVRRGGAKAWPAADDPACAVIFPEPGPGRASTEALITFAPTESFETGRTRAPAGNWMIQLRSKSGSTAAVHFYVTRNQANPDALHRGRQAFFVDQTPDNAYDPQRHLRSATNDPARPRSTIRRSGSLNSLATGAKDRGIVVVGSAYASDGKQTRYSSDGPAAGGNRPREGPDTLATADMSPALRGIVVAGTAGGHAVRVSGTSFAAPQVARGLANIEGVRQPDAQAIALSALAPTEDAPRSDGRASVKVSAQAPRTKSKR